jgi:hypothetical protein
MEIRSDIKDFKEEIRNDIKDFKEETKKDIKHLADKFDSKFDKLSHLMITCFFALFTVIIGGLCGVIGTLWHFLPFGK